jgi:hypothetical protein
MVIVSWTNITTSTIGIKTKKPPTMVVLRKSANLFMESPHYRNESGEEKT